MSKRNKYTVTINYLSNCKEDLKGNSYRIWVSVPVNEEYQMTKAFNNAINQLKEGKLFFVEHRSDYAYQNETRYGRLAKKAKRSGYDLYEYVRLDLDEGWI